MTDNIAVMEGFTQEVVAEVGGYVLHLLVKPNTFFDDAFKAWDMDAQEFVRINGWLCTIEDA